MLLALRHPLVAGRSCDDCARYIYDERTGRQMYRVGLPILRPAGVPTPCRNCPKIPLGSPPVRSSAIELTDRHWRTFEHYRQCRAVLVFPDDPIVRRNAAIIRDIEEAAATDRQVEPILELMAAIMAPKRR